MKEEYDEMCPICEKDIVVRDPAHWYNNEVLMEKRERHEGDGIDYEQMQQEGNIWM